MERMLEIGGARMAWEESGAGAAVVFVHGVIMDRRTWRLQQAAIVTARHRFVALDQRHHGRSDRRGEYSLARHAVDLAELLRALEGLPAVLVGHSYGANVAASVLLHAPELVAAAVLVEPALDGVLQSEADEVRAAVAERNRAFKAALSALKERGTVAGMRVLAEWTDNGHVGSWDEADPEYVAMLEQNAHTFALVLGTAVETAAIGPDALRLIRTPVLVVNGGETQAYFEAVGQAVADNIPTARRVVIAGASHDVACHNAPAFNGELLRFLEAVAQR